MYGRPSVLAGVALVAVAASSAERADADDALDVSARLVWQRLPGAESCIDRTALEAAVNRRWRRAVLVESDAAALVVEGRVGRTARDRWSASIEMRRRDGTSLGNRELVTRAADCSALDDSVALALGIMLDVSERRIVEEQAGAVPRGRPLDGPVIAIPKPTPAPRTSWHVEPLVAIEGVAGALPGFAFGGRVGASVIPPSAFRLQGSVSLFPAVDASAQRPGVRLSAWGAELAAYPIEVGQALHADFGVATRLLELHADGLGLYRNGSADETVVALGARAELAWRAAGAFELITGAGADAPLSRCRFVYRDTDGASVSLYETAPMWVEVWAGFAAWL